MDRDTLIKLLNVVALIVIMLSMGLNVRVKEVIDSARRPRLVVLGFLANFAVVPAITLLLLFLFHANPMVSVGFFTLAVCPGAPIGPPFADTAKGNVPLAISLMVILAGLSALLSPALLKLFAARLTPDRELHVDCLAIVRALLFAQILPMASGLGLREWMPKLTQAIAKPVGLLGKVLLVALVVVILTRQYEMLAAIRLRGWFGMGLLLLGSLGAGWVFGGSVVPNRKAMAMVTAPRNIAVGLAIATRSFANTPAVTAVVAYGLLSIVGTHVAAMVLGRFSLREGRSAGRIMTAGMD